jgi:hypothetical protein
MIHAETHERGAPTREGDEFGRALDQLSARDQRILGHLARRLAAVERAHGEAVALAVAERMETILRDRVGS